MDLYAFTISTPTSTYHECICSTDHDAALATIIATMPSDGILIEMEQV